MTTSVEMLEFPSGTHFYTSKWEPSFASPDGLLRNITDDNLEKSAGKGIRNAKEKNMVAEGEPLPTVIGSSNACWDTWPPAI